MNFNNKTILLTGASSGIGREMAIKLSGEKCRLALVSRRIELLDEMKERLTGCNAEIMNIQCDVSRKDDVAKAFSIIKEKFGEVDIAILNAGAGHRVTPQNFDSKYAEDIYGVNVMGMIYCIEKLLPDFLEKKTGMIAGVSSLADNRGFSGSGFYSSSKAAATFFLEGLRVELHKYGIKVITVKPGFVRTPMTDKNEFHMPFLMEADRAAGIIIDGIRKEKRVIQFPLPTVMLSKLVGLLPGRLYEFLGRNFMNGA